MISNIDRRRTPGFCFLFRNEQKILKSVIAPLGVVKYYTPDNYLTLFKVNFFLQKRKIRFLVIGTGSHELCGALFHYKIAPKSKHITVFNGHSNGNLKLSIIELSHPFTPFPSEIEDILTSKINLFPTTEFVRPSFGKGVKNYLNFGVKHPYKYWAQKRIMFIWSYYKKEINFGQ